MASATQPRLNTAAPGDGSRTMTMTIQDVQPRANDDPEDSTAAPEAGVLTLRGGQRRNRRHVVWDDDVVDNEGAGKKKSKSECALRGGLALFPFLSFPFRPLSTFQASHCPISFAFAFAFALVCCIYHKPKRFDESSSEESSDSDSDSDVDSGCEGHNHTHRHRTPLDRAAPARRRPAARDEGAARERGGADGAVHELELQDDSEPNAYEAAPSKKGKRKAT
ncbi:hypothetical protein FIBSPDRAFT_864708 [Athelia psychrophila]|uniref:Type 1 phosphatases regulator n=1 Tax=Athelia psychrophila TaxID=1759441 RepID=A0A166GD23_9AGAM|nr:hypothetical protein FIBSPDRAFT_864708 [Fibularhizoctonia sp. CBS 109695]